MGYVTPNKEKYIQKILIIVESVHNIDSHKYKCPNSTLFHWILLTYYFISSVSWKNILFSPFQFWFVNKEKNLQVTKGNNNQQKTSEGCTIILT